MQNRKKRKVTCRDNCISLYEDLLLEILGLFAHRQHRCSLKAAWSSGKKGKALHIPRRACHNLSSRLGLLRAINIIKKQANKHLNLISAEYGAIPGIATIEDQEGPTVTRQQSRIRPKGSRPFSLRYCSFLIGSSQYVTVGGRVNSNLPR